MDFRVMLTEEQMNERKRNIELLKKNGLVQDFLSRYKLDESFIEEHCSALLDWVNRVKLCKECSGLPYCVQSLKGALLHLRIDEHGYLEEAFVPCRFKKSQDEKMAHRDFFRLSHLSQEDYLIELKNISIENETNEYVMALTYVLKSLQEEKGLYLYGQPGVGKSYLLKGVCNYFAKEGKTVCFVHVPMLMQELKQAMTDNAYRVEITSKLRYCDVLVLDDIGAESISSWTRDDILLPILDERMNHKRKTYFSSNYTLEELEKQYRLPKQVNGQVSSIRIMERIRSLSKPVGLLGTSRRL